MLKKTARRFLSVRSGSAAAWTSTTFILFSVLFSLATVLSCASFAADQMIKAAVVSTTLESTSFRRWSQDLGYQETQLYPLTLGASGCPFVGVDVSGIKLPLMLDSGTARGFVITNQPLRSRIALRNASRNSMPTAATVANRSAFASKRSPSSGKFSRMSRQACPIGKCSPPNRSMEPWGSTSSWIGA